MFTKQTLAYGNLVSRASCHWWCI